MKRYQVFISSTYEDLKDERLAVLNALLSIDCFPAGMELFPAANEEQFSYIKKVIEKSAYYVLVIGGRYGSMDDNGVSYTEKEFDYAVKIGIPILAYIRTNIEDLPAKHVERTAEGMEKLDKFKEKVIYKRLIAFWNDKHELAAKVITGLEKAFVSTPRPGMVHEEDIDTVSAVVEYFKILTDETKRQSELITNLQNETEKNRMILESFNVKKNIYANKGLQIKKSTRLTGLFKTNIKQKDTRVNSNRQVNDYVIGGRINFEDFIAALVYASISLRKFRTGALIVIEKKIPLVEFMSTGLYMDCLISGQVLINIFEHNTPLHDGAVIIRGTRIVSATCYLPLTENFKKWKVYGYGTRHRAAIGVSEVADCVTIVVSEETGNISLTYKGEIYTKLDEKQLRNKLDEFLSDVYIG